MRVALAYDHRGRKMADGVKSTVERLGHECIDLGSQREESVDFPDFAHLAAKKVAENEVDTAILLGATGMEMTISANKFKGDRAARCNDELDAHAARVHLDANVLCLPGELLTETVLRGIVEVWLTTDFENRARSERRIRKIEAMEEGTDPNKMPGEDA